MNVSVSTFFVQVNCVCVKNIWAQIGSVPTEPTFWSQRTNHVIFSTSPVFLSLHFMACHRLHVSSKIISKTNVQIRHPACVTTHKIYIYIRCTGSETVAELSVSTISIFGATVFPKSKSFLQSNPRKSSTKFLAKSNPGTTCRR